MQQLCKPILFFLILFTTVACDKTGSRPPAPGPARLVEAIENNSTLQRLVYDEEGQLAHVQQLDKLSNLLLVHEYDHGTAQQVRQVRIGTVIYQVEERLPGIVAITTSYQGGEQLFYDELFYEGGKLMQHINYSYQGNQRREENKYVYSYDPDGNLARIHLLTHWEDEWKPYGRIEFGPYADQPNHLSAFDLLHPDLNFQLPLILDWNGSTFRNEPLEMRTYSAAGDLLQRHVFEYEHDNNRRTQRRETIYFQNNPISRDTLHYSYKD
ncbi:hypothetical protein KJS94_14550 [Flavihumibacter rivuli]|uniref:hypothetical protein n=1 Tax=Flavihumibacter rivuli TaxID=2838156 RepID=UPI001BDE0548|nr:hypothetical protein [Flavihumibacter rivuli]ULQ55867.1 hypothetical protein KJS94_14550 [Flavihumibacter rivuli]